MGTLVFIPLLLMGCATVLFEMGITAPERDHPAQAQAKLPTNSLSLGLTLAQNAKTDQKSSKKQPAESLQRPEESRSFDPKIRQLSLLSDSESSSLADLAANPNFTDLPNLSESNQVVFANLPPLNETQLDSVAATFEPAVESKDQTIRIVALPSFGALQDSDSNAWGSLTDSEAREVDAQRNLGYLSEDQMERSSDRRVDELNTAEGQFEVAGQSNAKSTKRPAKRQIQLQSENPNWWVEEINKPLLESRNPIFTTLDEVIFTALKNAPQIQILNTQPRIQELLRDETAADFDWAAFVESRFNDQNDPIGSTLTQGNLTSGRFEQRDWAFEAGVTKRLTTGGDLRVGQSFGTVDNNSNFLNPPNQGSARLLLDYRQPLLRGAGRGFNTSQIVLADLDFQSITNESRAQLQAYLVEVVDAFWDIYQRRALLVQSRRSMERAQELYRQLKSRDGIDVTNDQLLRAEAAIASRRSSLIRAEYDLINAQDVLINLAVGQNADNLDTVELLPETLVLPMGVEFESTQLVQAAIHNRPEVQQALTRIRTGAIQSKIALNLLRPRLDAVISTFVSGLRGDNDVGGAFSDQFSVGEPSYTVGFEFEVPFGNRAAKLRLERRQLEAANFQQEFRRQVGDVVLDVRVAGREIERLNKENKNNFLAMNKASQELTLIRQRQQLNLDDNKTGSLYIEDLLGSQARLTAAENRLVISQTEQAVALVDLKRATGELFRSGIGDCYASECVVSDILLESPVPSSEPLSSNPFDHQGSVIYQSDPTVNQ